MRAITSCRYCCLHDQGLLGMHGKFEGTLSLSLFVQTRVCAGSAYETTHPAAELQRRFDAEATAPSPTSVAASVLKQPPAGGDTSQSRCDARYATGQIRSTPTTAKGKTSKEYIEELASNIEDASQETAGALGDMSNSTASFLARHTQLKVASLEMKQQAAATKLQIERERQDAQDRRMLRNECMQRNMIVEREYAQAMKEYKELQTRAVSDARKDALVYASQSGMPPADAREWVKQAVQDARTELPSPPKKPALLDLPDLKQTASTCSNQGASGDMSKTSPPPLSSPSQNDNEPVV